MQSDQDLEALVKLLPSLSHQLWVSPFLQLLSDCACRIQSLGVLVPLVQRHLVQLGLCCVQPLFHALESAISPIWCFEWVSGCWLWGGAIRKAVPFVELRLQNVRIPERGPGVTYWNPFHGKMFRDSLSLEQRLEGNWQKKMGSQLGSWLWPLKTKKGVQCLYGDYGTWLMVNPPYYPTTSG